MCGTENGCSRDNNVASYTKNEKEERGSRLQTSISTSINSGGPNPSIYLDIFVGKTSTQLCDFGYTSFNELLTASALGNSWEIVERQEDIPG
jgi:hypothetical protein